MALFSGSEDRDPQSERQLARRRREFADACADVQTRIGRAANEYLSVSRGACSYRTANYLAVEASKWHQLERALDEADAVIARFADLK